MTLEKLIEDFLNPENRQYNFVATKGNNVFLREKKLDIPTNLRLGIINLENLDAQTITLAKLKKDFKIVSEQEAKILLVERLKLKTEKKLNELLFVDNQFIRDLAKEEIDRREKENRQSCPTKEPSKSS